MAGFEYIQRSPYEIFRVPDRTEHIQAAIALLSFCAYPDEKQMRHRSRAADALTAWLLRRQYGWGVRGPVPVELNRDSLPAKVVDARVYKAARRFEFEALPLVGVALDLGFRKMGGYQMMARMMGAAFGAEHVTVRLPTHFDKESSVFLKYLKDNLSKVALNDQKQAIADFKRRR